MNCSFIRKTIVVIAGMLLCATAPRTALHAASPAQNHVSLGHVLQSLADSSVTILNKECFDATAPWVIHIQDYHCQYDIQRQIARTIESIANACDGAYVPVCIEGAHGVIDTGLLASIPSGRIRSYVVDYFMRKGEISGAESYAVLNNPHGILHGVDDIELYNESHRLYAELFKAQIHPDRHLNHIDRVSRHVFDSELSEGARTIVQAGMISLRNKYDFESFIAATRSYWMSLPRDDLPPAFFRLTELIDRQDTIPASTITAASAELANLIIASADKETALTVQQLNAAFRLGVIGQSQYIRELTVLAQAHGIDAACGAALVDYLAYITQIDEITADIAYSACAAVYDTLKSRFLTPRQQDAASAVETWQSLRTLFALETSRRSIGLLTDDDISAMFAHFAAAERGRFAEQRRITPALIARYKARIDAARTFYANSIARDTALINGTLAQLEQTESPGAVLIAGGFHTPGIVAACRSRKINYAVVTPHSDKPLGDTTYTSVLLADLRGRQTILPMLRENRLAPRVLLANMLADTELSGRIIKESILLAKVLNIAQSHEIFARRLTQQSEEPLNFRLHALQANLDFIELWTERFKQIRRAQGAHPKPREIERFRILLRDLVSINTAFLHQEYARLGIEVLGSPNTAIQVLVTGAEQKRILRHLAEAYPNAPQFEVEETIGPFVLYFHRNYSDENIEPYMPDFTPETPPGNPSYIADLLIDIENMQTKLLEDPFNRQLKYIMNKKMCKIADFLRFAARKEMLVGNEAQANLLEANAALYEEHIEKARKFFQAYLDCLDPSDTNLAGRLFTRGTVMRGEFVSLALTAEDGEPFVDQYGNPLALSLIDQNLTYGTDTPATVKTRLIERAKTFMRNDKEYISKLLKSASRLIVSNDNQDELYIAVLTGDGQDAYHSSLLGGKQESFGAISDGMFKKKAVRKTTPRLTYLYDRRVTGRMAEQGVLHYNLKRGTGKTTEPLPADSITALVVNRQHAGTVIPRLARYPQKTVPVIDTNGALLWRNADIAELAKSYGAQYSGYLARKEAERDSHVYVKTVRNPAKLIAFSDYHSDYRAFHNILLATGVLNKENEFIAEPGTVIVINGDVIDRGTGEAQRRLLDAIMAVQQQAAQNGCQLILTMGNHERNFISGNWKPYLMAHIDHFLTSIGFPAEEMARLQKIFQTNDLYELSLLRARHPQPMKYIDFLWTLPLIAQVGGHVFIHSGPIEYFNTLIEQTMRAHPDWSTETVLDYIFQKEIRSEGFASGLFGDKDYSIIASKGSGTPPFLTNPEITERFLSFFAGASFLGIGHRKSLGIMEETNSKHDIFRISGKRNVIKLDHGINYDINADKDTRIPAKAYVVDPLEDDYIFEIDEHGNRTSLYERGDSRFELMRSESAYLLDKVIPSPVQPRTEKEEQRKYIYFLKTVLKFRFKAKDFAGQSDKFNRKTRQILDDVGTFRKNLKHIKALKTSVQHLLDMYFVYLDRIQSGYIDKDDISLKNFQNFVKKYQKGEQYFTATESAGRRKATKTDMVRFVAAVDHSDIENISPTILMHLKTRLAQKLEDHTTNAKTSKRIVKGIESALQTLNELGNTFRIKTLRNHDGNPGIFSYKDGMLNMTFVHDGVIYLSSELVHRLWSSYKDTDDTAYLDMLLALVVYELHRYGADDIPDKKMLHTYKQAQKLETALCGDGKKGSALDDYIHGINTQWRSNARIERKAVITKFLWSFQDYVRATNDMNFYRTLFITLGIPAEAGIMDDFDLADALFTTISRDHPGDVFNAAMSVISNPVLWLLKTDYGHFTDRELIILTDAIFKAKSYVPLSHKMEHVLQKCITTINHEQLPKKAYRKRIKRQHAIETSL